MLSLRQKISNSLSEVVRTSLLKRECLYTQTATDILPLPAIWRAVYEAADRA